MKNGTIVILSERLAGWLMFNRFHKIDEKVDLKNPDRNIYIFKDSPQLRQAMENYKNHNTLVV